MENLRSYFQTSLKGLAMGMAEVIPGVSGGTIAFITGIYERLLLAIKAFGPDLFQGFKKDGIKGAWEAIDGTFLLFLALGMAIGIIGGVFGITYILEHYPPVLWAFFFGLIIASTIYIFRQVDQWSISKILAFLIGTGLAFSITVLNPGQGNEALWFIFISGAIAISALILPGISGSFILLLMGMYTVIIPTVKDALKTFEGEKLLVLAVFAAGCVVGLVTFSRVLSWTFKYYRDTTLALLTGFMVGSLNKIWPWRKVLTYRTNSSGEQVPYLEQNVLPGAYDGDPMVLAAIVSLMIGFGIVFLLDAVGTKKPVE